MAEENKRRFFFLRRKQEGVATNIYLRETLEKQKKKVCELEKKGFESCLHIGKVLEPHAPVTKNDNL